MNHIPLLGAISVVLTALTVSAPACASGTLDKIRQTHTINLGTREAARPFSFLNEQKQTVGYSVDLCLKAVEQIRKELKLPEIKVNYITVSGAERIPKLADGSIDLECGSTTNTKQRQEKVDFSYTIFVAGMKMVTRADSGISKPASLAGKTVALSKGTTSEKLFNQLRDAEISTMKLVQYPNNVEALRALDAGKVNAFPQDDVLLAGLLTTLPNANQYKVVGDYLSVEPYAIMVRKGDADLLAIVDKTLSGIFASGEINTIYDRWFNSDKLKVPMSGLLRDSILRPGKEAGIARILGYSL